GKLGFWIAVEHFMFVAFDLNYNGLENPPLTAIDCGDYPTARRGIAYTFCLFVREQQLTTFDTITHLHFPRGSHSHIVKSYECYLTHSFGILDGLCRRAAYREVQASLDLYH